MKRTVGLHLVEAFDSKAVFEDYPTAPLSSFASRTVMAEALGIIDSETAADLAVIREIRNTFAHSVLPIAFNRPEIAHLVEKTRKLRDETWSLFNAQYQEPRDRYVITCAIHYTALAIYKGPEWRQPKPPVNWLAQALQDRPTPARHE